MIVLDACVVIAFLHQHDAHHEAALALINAAPEIPLAMSVISLAEALQLPARHGFAPEAQLAVEQVEISIVDVVADDGVALADLRNDTGLALPDCCVIAAAERHKAAVATFDLTLAREARRRGLEVLVA